MSNVSVSQQGAKARSVSSFIFVAIVLVLAIVAVVQPGSKISFEFGDKVNLIDELWVLFAAALVFFMQIGFLAYEVGLARPAHATVVAVKNVVDWTISSIGFTAIGFGIMFGSSVGGFFGTDLFALQGISDLSNTVSGPTFFLFNLAFAGTAITLVSGSLVERTTLLAYSIVAVAIALLIYPVFGHWVWGDFLNADNGAWLARIGFRDFAGASVVHLVGATVALVGLVIIGPRIGRFGPKGEVNEVAPSNVGFTMMGVLVLWFGWWGFNGGSHLALDGNVTSTIINTNLAGVSGLVAGGLWAYMFHGRYALNTKLVGGAIGGLVAITACANIVSPLSAVVIGLVAGIVYAIGHDWLLTLKIDDALGVVPAHGFGGIWGLLAVGIFGPSELFEQGRLVQIFIQLAGAAVAIAWAGGVSFIIYRIIQRFVGLRIAPSEELGGASLEVNENMDPMQRLKAKVKAHSASINAGE
ncbi:MAG: ammonium transporter [Ilumatobacter sp.]